MRAEARDVEATIERAPRPMRVNPTILWRGDKDKLVQPVHGETPADRSERGMEYAVVDNATANSDHKGGP